MSWVCCSTVSCASFSLVSAHFCNHLDTCSLAQENAPQPCHIHIFSRFCVSSFFVFSLFFHFYFRLFFSFFFVRFFFSVFSVRFFFFRFFHPVPRPEECFICPCFFPSFVHILFSASFVVLTSGTCGTAMHLDIRSDRIRCYLLSPFFLVSQCAHNSWCPRLFTAAFRTSYSRFQEKIIASSQRSSALIVNSLIPGWPHVGTRGHSW